MSAVFAVAACGSNDTSTTAPVPQETTPSKALSTSTSAAAPKTTNASGDSTSTSATAGTYVDYATYKADPKKYAAATTVLFFHASWCPACKAADTSLTTDGVPAQVTIVKVDFDAEKEAKKKYNVTQQHTFVSIDQNGQELKKWSGGKSGEDIAKKAA